MCPLFNGFAPATYLCYAIVLVTGLSDGAQDSDKDYQEIPYVRPGPFKPCDLGELDKFMPNNIRTCALTAVQGSMPVGLLQQTISMACMLFKKCSVFIKKGTFMPEDNEHHCMHGQCFYRFLLPYFTHGYIV